MVFRTTLVVAVMVRGANKCSGQKIKITSYPFDKVTGSPDVLWHCCCQLIVSIFWLMYYTEMSGLIYHVLEKVILIKYLT